MSQKQPLLIVGEGSSSLGKRLANRLDAEIAQVEMENHPDGERYARINNLVAGREVFVLHGGSPPSHMIDLLMLLNAAVENGASRVVCVAPYLPTRQDRVFESGEAIWAKTVMQLIGTQTDELITVELHKSEVANHFHARCVNLSTDELFANEFVRRGIDVVIAPDIGARDRARRVAKLMGGVKSDHLEKKRISGDKVEILPKSLNVRGLHVAILDDMISTGGTMEIATRNLIAQGAASVTCAATHGLFIGDAAGRLIRAGAESLVVSDTIDSPYAQLTVADLIAKAIQR